jgi:tetratricopeptide (TPR) repeat protein
MTPHLYTKTNYPCAVFTWVFLLIFSLSGQTQNVSNDTLYVNTKSIVELIFKEASSGAIPNGDGSYEIRGGTNTSLLIRAKKKQAKAQPLIVNEGAREHKFILVYQENAPAARLDYSSPQKIGDKQPATMVQTAPEAKPAAIKDDGGRRPNKAEREMIKEVLQQGNGFYAKKQWDSSRAKYLQLTPFKFNERKVVLQRLQEIETVKAAEHAEKEKMFAAAIAKADEQAALKNYIGEEQALKTALTYRPGDVAVQKRLVDIKPKVVLQTQEQHASMAKDLMSKGDIAVKEKKYLQADSLYDAAQKLDPANTLIAARKKKIKPYVDDAKFKMAKLKGDDLFKSGDYTNAQVAYEEAITYKPKEGSVLAQLKKIKQLITVQLQRKNYQDAITIADKARDGKEYKKALSEYQRAKRIFPDSTYPGRQIQFINQLQKEQSNKSVEKDSKVKASPGKPA